MNPSKINKFLLILGFFFIFDGIVSIIFQIDESLMYQLPRITRIILGLYILIFSFQEFISTSYESIIKINYLLIPLGIILTIDGIISIIDQINEPLIFQIGRIIRIIFGLLIVIYPFKKKVDIIL